MYTYIFEGVNAQINTPGISDFSQIKNEVLLQTKEENVLRSTYPNGLILTIQQKLGRTVVYSNRPLTKNPDGSYTAPES